eukprot:242853-Rhodomonas_salina.2
MVELVSWGVYLEKALWQSHPACMNEASLYTVHQVYPGIGYLGVNKKQLNQPAVVIKGANCPPDYDSL